MRDASSRVALAMAPLVASGAGRELDAAGVELAVVTQAAVRTMALRMVTAATREVRSPQRRAQRWVQSRALTALETSPATLLRDMLRDDLVRVRWTPDARHTGATTTRPLSDILTDQADTPQARAWRQVMAAALSAERDGTILQFVTPRRQVKSVSRDDIPFADGKRWAVAADAAAIVAASSTLDADIAQAASRYDPGIATIVEASATSGLRAVADRTLRLAQAGPLPDWGASVTDDEATTRRRASVSQYAPTPRVRPAQVTDTPTAIDATRRLPQLISQARGITPGQARRLCKRQAQLMTYAARVLAPADPGRASAASAMASQLGAVATRGDVAPLIPGSPEPATQQDSIVQALRQVPPDSRAAQVICAAVVDHTPGMIRALDERVRGAITAGQWAITDRTEASMWVPTSHRPRRIPAVSEHLRRAREGIDAIAASATGRQPVALRPAREVLGPDLTMRRPERPGVVVAGGHAAEQDRTESPAQIRIREVFKLAQGRSQSSTQTPSKDPHRPPQPPETTRRRTL